MQEEPVNEPQPEPVADPEPRKVVGFVWCPKCLADDKYESSQVRKSVKGKLYIVCPTCSLDMCTGKSAQDWVLRHMKGTPEELTKRAAKNDPPPPPAPPEKAKGGGFFSHINKW